MTETLRSPLWLSLACAFLPAGCFQPLSAQSEAPASRLLEPDDLKGLAWRSVGPANMGGRVADIALAPGNPKSFYVAFGTGGLFKTTNHGTTLKPVFDQEATASVGSVVVADAPPDWPGWETESSPELADLTPQQRAEKGRAKIVWVGTGEGNNRNSSSWGHGVYRSTDGGGTFVHLGLADSHDIPALAVDPRNPDVCYVAALGHLWGPNPQRGLYKTTDGGKTWNPILQIDENTGACDVILDPQNPDTVYAAMYMRRRTAYSFQSGGPQGGIYRSTDAGRTWTKLTKGLPSQTGRLGLDIYAKDPRILYAVVESDVGGHGVSPWDGRSRSGGVFRSDDGGDTWQRTNERTPRSFYYSKIRIDPNDDRRIYLLGSPLAVSDDGGKNFRAGGARKPHVDMHALVIDPDDSDHLLLGSDGGLYISYDRGKTWDFLNHLAVGEFYNIAVDMSEPYRIAGGMQDNGTWIGPSATGRDRAGGFMDREPGGITNQDWRFVHNGDGFHVAFDPVDPDIFYAEMQGGGLVRIHLDTGFKKHLRPSPKEGQARFRFNWNAPFFISPHDHTVLYFGGNVVFKLTERGDYWEVVSPDLTTHDPNKFQSIGSEAETHCTVVSLAESPLVPGMIWAGTDDGLIHLTTDAGQSWTNVTPPQVNGLYVAKIEPSHHRPDTAYVAVDGHRSDDMEPHLLVTDDAGRTFRAITGDLPTGASVKVVREDLGNPEVLYVGTERAAFVTIDRGRHWVKLNGDSLPTAAVDDLVQHPREMDLVAGTHGRSIYVLDDVSPLAQLTPEVLDSQLHLFDIPDAKPRYLLPYGGLWSDRMFVAKNPPTGARITYWLRDYTGEEVRITVTDTARNVIGELTGPNRPGLNRAIWDLQLAKHDRFNDLGFRSRRPEFVPAGDYTVTVTCGKQSAKKTVTVLPAPDKTETR